MQLTLIDLSRFAILLNQEGAYISSAELQNMMLKMKARVCENLKADASSNKILKRKLFS